MRVGDVLDSDRCADSRCEHQRADHEPGDADGVFCSAGISVVGGEIVVTCFCTEFVEPEGVAA